MEGENGGLVAAKTKWAAGDWDCRREIWEGADAMLRAQLVLMCDDCALDAEGQRFYRELIERKDKDDDRPNETYFVRGHAALALAASQNADAMLYLSGKMDRDGKDFDTSEYVRAMCAQSIGRNSDFVGSMQEKERERVLSILKKALDNDEPVVVENAIFALGQLHDEGSAADMYAVAQKLEKQCSGKGERGTALETVALAFCEMGLTETYAMAAYVRVLVECPDYHVAERVKEFVEEILMHSNLLGKERLAKALEVYGRKVQLSSIAGDLDKPDSVVGAAVHKRRASAVPPAPELGGVAKPPPLPTKLRLR
ncbi:MAG: hypothetical protein WC350_04545 [Candidatus Micrarchaeia archaeon]|jgi:hypothetical protein